MKSWRIGNHFLHSSSNYTIRLLLTTFAVLSPLAYQSAIAQPAVIDTIQVGAFPRGIGINPNTNRIYIANETAGGSLSVIDGATNSIITTIPFGGSNPVGVGVNPNTERIYVADWANSRVFVVDGHTNSVITRISVGNRPEGVGVDPSTNRIYIANTSSDSISVIDGNSHTVITAIPVGSGPRWIGVNPITNLIYALSENGGSISVIDGMTNSVIKTIFVATFPGPVPCCGVPPFPRGVGINTQTNRIYVGSGSDFYLFMIDGVSNDIIETIPIGSFPTSDVGINPDTNRLYVRDARNLVDVIDGATNNIIATLQVGSGGNCPEMAVNPTTSRIYVVNDHDDTVSVIEDLVTSAPVAICKNVTVSAGPNCTANASIDNGSSDPGGLPITLVQSPLGPYPKGTTNVTLTVTNSDGASSQCTGTVTVIDTKPPAINILRINPASLWPPNQKMLPVKVIATASDRCSPPVTCKIVSIKSNEPVDDPQGDWVITGDLTANLKAERLGDGKHYKGCGRIYTVTVRCTDGAGNSTTKDVFVTVPHDKGK